MQTEAMARRAQSSRANADFSESSSSSGSDLSKMLAPPDESKAASGMSRNLREFRSPEVSSSRRSAEPNELGAGSGSELSLGPNITGPRLGPDLGESRTSGSLLDRNSDPERVNRPYEGSDSAVPSHRDHQVYSPRSTTSLRARFLLQHLVTLSSVPVRVIYRRWTT
jgi:hypothetical protein